MCHERESYVLGLNSKNSGQDSPVWLRGIEEFASGNYRGLTREHLVQQAGMDFRIAIGAVVFYNDEPIIGVGGVLWKEPPGWSRSRAESGCRDPWRGESCRDPCPRKRLRDALSP